MKIEYWSFSQEKGYLKNEKLIESIPQLFECIDAIWFGIWQKNDYKLKEESPWYRGVGQVAFELIPSIYRPDIWKYNAIDARDIREEFARRAEPFKGECRFYSPVENYHIMQHYGLPTRLLDWTEGLLLAAYFSIRNFTQLGKEASPCVWMINPWWLNNKSTRLRELYDSRFQDIDRSSKRIVNQYLIENKLPLYPVAILPPHNDKRIVTQKSVFTIHGSRKNGFRDLCAKYKNPQLAKICLDRSKIETIEDQLFTAGITETSVFPELEGLAREIRYQYNMRY